MKHRRILVAMLALILAVGTGLTLFSSQNTSTVQASKRSSYYYKRLMHNAYVYKRNGKRVGRTVYRKGRKVWIYDVKILNGDQRIYRISRNRYLKAGNFSKKPITRTETTVIATRHTRAIFSGYPVIKRDVDKGFKKGHVFHVDAYGILNEGVAFDLAFRIKNKHHNEWILAKDVIPKQEMKFTVDWPKPSTR